jgi:adenylate cyclase
MHLDITHTPTAASPSRPPLLRPPPSSRRRPVDPAGFMGGDAAEGPPIVVLMVDDEPLTARAAQRLLSTDAGIHFHACSDPAAAVALAEEIRPTLILQDMVMPESDGLSMLQAFRTNAVTRDVPIIVLSSEEDPVIKAHAFAAGADDYMVKFPDRIEMLARIRHHVSRYRAGREHDQAVLAEDLFLRETLGRYVSHPVAEQLLETPDGLDLGGSLCKVTIMMTDLRGFTALSERLRPERMVTLLNNYLDVMTEILVRHGGTIDELIGDAILAVFGAPQVRLDDAERAVACAVEMQLAMDLVNAKNRAAGLPEVEMGVGINTGEVVVGNIGSSTRAKYGVVGAAVNLTARIESYTTGGQVLISAATLDAAGPSVVVDEHMEVSPKGVERPVSVYRVSGIQGRYQLSLRRNVVEMIPPKSELCARFTVLHGKDAGGEQVEGRVVRISRQTAEIVAPEGVPALANLRLRLTAPDGRVVGGDLYGKVTGPGSEPGAFVVRFTSTTMDADWL